MNIYELRLLNFSYISVLTWKLLPSESILIIQIATKKPDIDLKNTLKLLLFCEFPYSIRIEKHCPEKAP